MFPPSFNYPSYQWLCTQQPSSQHLYSQSPHLELQQIIVLSRKKRSRVVRKINTWVKYRYLKNLLKYSNKVSVFHYQGRISHLTIGGTTNQKFLRGTLNLPSKRKGCISMSKTLKITISILIIVINVHLYSTMYNKQQNN